MAIRVVNKVGIADTEAEIVASDYDANTVIYCKDTEQTLVKVGSSFVDIEYYNITGNFTVVKSIKKYYINTSAIGSSVTITLPTTLTEGEAYLFKRTDTNVNTAYDIIFTSTLLIDRSNNDLTFSNNQQLNAISFVKYGDNLYII